MNAIRRTVLTAHHYVVAAWLSCSSAGSSTPATHERTGDDVRLETADFTTHGVIVGMTGSGKTGLGVVLIEEVLRPGCRRC